MKKLESSSLVSASLAKNLNTRRIKEIVVFSLMGLCVVLSLAGLFVILAFVFSRGLSVVSWEFLSTAPRAGMTEGGIYPAIIGTFYLVIGAIVVAAPFGIGTAIYLSEYSKQNRISRVIRVGVNNLAGVPSVVFGLFGLAVFVKYFDFGVSILAGSCTLGALILPTIIRASEESLMSVPAGYRQASFALGATKWQTVSRCVLPSAFPGIITGIILSIGRAAGETAPIIFTAATFYSRRLPSSIFSEVMALPYHIYASVSTGMNPAKQIPIAYGAALVLLVLVLSLNLIATLVRMRYTSKNTI